MYCVLRIDKSLVGMKCRDRLLARWEAGQAFGAAVTPVVRLDLKGAPVGARHRIFIAIGFERSV